MGPILNGYGVMSIFISRTRPHVNHVCVASINFASWLAHPSTEGSVSVPRHLGNKGNVGWVIAWLQADRNAAAGYSRHCVRCIVVDWFNCEWRVAERFVEMPLTFTHEEYADMVYVYGYCNGNENAPVDEYRRRSVSQNTKSSCFYQRILCITWLWDTS